MRTAYHLALKVLPLHSSKFSRQDFTLPQLFACLVLREHQRKSYRGVEALLRDCPNWCRDIGMDRAPDHNTLWRAFHAILGPRSVNGMLDLLAQWFAQAQMLSRVLGMDSSVYDTHHRSRHYEQRCRHYSSSEKSTANARRSRTARRTPKLAIAGDVRWHAILSARTRTGMGSDCHDFAPLLRGACRRCRRIKTVLADAGYDSHKNHELARKELGVESLIKASAGRPGRKEPTSCHRRLMKRLLNGSQQGKPYGQRAQIETIISMLKRNLGDELRAHSDSARDLELLLRVITHDIMLLWRIIRGSRQSRSGYFLALRAS